MCFWGVKEFLFFFFLKRIREEGLMLVFGVEAGGGETRLRIEGVGSGLCW